MFSAARVKDRNQEAFCMICGLEEGQREWLKSICCTRRGVQVNDPKEEAWYHSLQLKDGESQLVDGTDVYLFHEVPCWHRLVEHFGPGELHLPSLFEALEHLPLPRSYDFPVLLSLPGRIETWSWARREDEEHMSPIFPGRFPFPDLDELQRFARQPPQPVSAIARGAIDHPTNPFNRLPIEVIVRIACLLSTSDALSLRQISRAAMPLFTNSTFWRTRFMINGERGFLLPLVRKSTTPGHRDDVDWRRLYHSTARLNCSDWFEIEIQSWERLRWLRDTASALQLGNPRPPDFRGSPPLQHYHNTTRQNTFIQSVDVTSSLCKIAISAHQDSGEVNITGLEFIFNDGRPAATLGYTTPGAKQIKGKEYARNTDRDCRMSWPYPGIRVTVNIDGLRGILFIKDADGIHGISIFHNGEDFDEIDSPLCVGIPACDSYTMPIAYSVSLNKVDKVFAVSDNRKMIDLGISGTMTRRWEYDEDEWEEAVERYRKDPVIAGVLKSR